MKLVEVFDQETISEARMVWRRVGKSLKRAIRCTAGPRKGRVVSSADQCSKPINMKKRMQMKKTRAQKGARMARISRRTKRMNPASKRLKTMNRR
jgi:hypothetical protein